VQCEQLLKTEGNDDSCQEQEGVPNEYMHIEYNDAFKTSY
jgi:hypothetical protein